jgi:2,3-bisphosphoglycerate-dependent phosphoglycerate mutase
MEIVVIRHGESEANANNVVQGRGDYHLSRAGLAQAQRAALALAALPPGRVYVSPLTRARETAAVINRGHGAPFTVLDDLIEYNLGEFEGLTPEEINLRFPHVPAALRSGAPFHTLAPGAETDAEVEVRAERALRTIVAADLPRVYVVSHLGLLERLLRLAVGQFNFANYLRDPQRHLQNCSITRLLISPDGNRALCVNDTAHLE